MIDPPVGKLGNDGQPCRGSPPRASKTAALNPVVEDGTRQKAIHVPAGVRQDGCKRESCRQNRSCISLERASEEAKGQSKAEMEDPPKREVPAEIKKQWQGYYAYQQLVVKQDRVFTSATDDRAALLLELTKINASCFWMALATTTEAAVVRRLMSDRSVQKPITAEQALQLTEKEPSVNLYWHNVDSGRAEPLRPLAAKYTSGVMQVMFDDRERVEPHWLPILKVKREKLEWKPSPQAVKKLLKHIDELTEKRAEKKKESKGKQVVMPGNLFELLEDEMDREKRAMLLDEELFEGGWLEEEVDEPIVVSEVATSSHVVSDEQLARELFGIHEQPEVVPSRQQSKHNPKKGCFQVGKLPTVLERAAGRCGEVFSGLEMLRCAASVSGSDGVSPAVRQASVGLPAIIPKVQSVGVGSTATTQSVGVGNPGPIRPPPQPAPVYPLLGGIPFCGLGFGETPPPNWTRRRALRLPFGLPDVVRSVPFWIGGTSDEACPWALSFREAPRFPWEYVISQLIGASFGWWYGSFVARQALKMEQFFKSLFAPKPSKMEVAAARCKSAFEAVVAKLGNSRDPSGMVLTRGIFTKAVLSGGIVGLSGLFVTGFWQLWKYCTRQERHLFESRKTVVVGASVCEGDFLYQRVMEDHGTNALLNSDRMLKIAEIAEIDCGERKFVPGPIGRLVGPQGQQYLVAELQDLLCGESYAMRCWRALGLPKRYKVCKIGLRPQQEVALTVDSLYELPTEEAKVRALYTMMKPLLPDEMVGVVNDIRNAHLAAGPAVSEAQKVVKQTVQVGEAVKKHLLRVPAFGHSSTRSPKSCVSCGCEPPEKYRWKHRICSNCAVALERNGYTTWSGFQVQENLHVPTCYPGIVRVRGEQKPPKAAKWRLVPEKLPVKVCWNLAGVAKLSKMDKGFKWDSFMKSDLEKLKQPFEPRWTHALVGIGCSGARPMVTANTQYNCAKALCGRVFLQLKPKPWDPKGGPLPGIWDLAYSLKDEILPDLATEPMQFEEWLDSMPKRRQPALKKGKLNLDRTGWIKLYEAFCSFLKTELLPGFDKEHGDLVQLQEMLDRLINGPSEESHCVAGRYLKPKIAKLKKHWHAESHLFYGSAGPEALHRFLQRLVAEERQFFWCDFSMFDRTHSNATWSFMEKFYQEIEDEQFWAVMQAWRAPRGKIGAFKFSADVMNASGRDDTALVNAVLNGFASYLSACAAWLEKPVEFLTAADILVCKSQILLSVCGDDSLGGLPLCGEDKMARFRAIFDESISKFGFVAKLCTSPVIEDAVYLGMRPYPTRKGVFWGKTIGRASYKMGWVLDKGQDLMAHVTGIADMHVLCSRHVPVLGDLAEKIVELRAGARRTPMKLDENKPWEWTYKSGVEYDEITLQSVARAYSSSNTPGNPKEFTRDVSVQDVKGLIAEIRAVKRLPCVIDHWLWKHMVFADDL